MGDLHPPIKQQHYDTIIIMTVPSGGVAQLHEIPPRHTNALIFYNHKAVGLARIKTRTWA